MSKGKKIALVVVGILLVLIIAVAGVGAKIYFDVKGTADKAYEPVERKVRSSSRAENKSDLNNKDPFSVLLLGIDTGEFDREDVGRSDTMILATVNPKESKTTLISLPRDVYAEIVGYGTNDKWNHAYAFGGAAMSMDTVEKFLDVPIDHFVSIDMGGFEKLVDAVGGVTVDNKMKFTQDNHTFEVGKLNLNGEEALAYSRMRKEDPNGDFGRQERQRSLITAILNKALSVDGITNYSVALTILGDTLNTDLTFGQMKKIAADYRSALTNIVPDQLAAEGFMQDEIYYQRVTPEELQRVKTEVNTQLGL